MYLFYSFGAKETLGLHDHKQYKGIASSADFLLWGNGQQATGIVSSISHTLTCYWLVLFMVFNTIRVSISRNILEEDVLVPTDRYKEIIDHLSLDNLEKPPLQQTLPSCSQGQLCLECWPGSWVWQCHMVSFLHALQSSLLYFLCNCLFCHWCLSQLGWTGGQLGWAGTPRCRGKDCFSIFLSRGRHGHIFSEHLKHHCSLSLNPDQSAEVLDFFFHQLFLGSWSSLSKPPTL